MTATSTSTPSWTLHVDARMDTTSWSMTLGTWVDVKDRVNLYVAVKLKVWVDV